ncbi:MAG: bifunctional nicotinamide-nucleotide adenylyltransferase/Nudix hydroxylase [Deinococcaceae bacterium]
MRRHKHTFGVFIGRFQPPHRSHIEVMLEALGHVDRLIVIFGSAKSARSVKNPFTVEERQRMVLDALDSQIGPKRVLFGSVRDHFYNENLWLAEVQREVLRLTKGNEDILLMGHQKDESSYYLRSFPRWDYRETPISSPLNATDIRNGYFSGEKPSTDVLPKAVIAFLEAFSETREFIDLKEEFSYVQDYKKLWESAPFLPTFVTTDAVVVKSGYVLLIRRKQNPGRGKLAMPGGFLDTKQTLLASCIRELKEETSIALTQAQLEECLRKQYTFDYPERSLRGRTITQVFHFDLGNGQLPKVEGQDDAESAFWMPISEVLGHPEWFFEDHHAIVEHFLLKN